jgi:hypothetical protein
MNQPKISRRFVLAAAAWSFGGIVRGADESARALPRFSKGDEFAHFKQEIVPILEGIADAERLVLYEGMPHQGNEKALAKALQEHRSIKRHGFDFYDAQIPVRDEAVKEFRKLFSDPKSYRTYGGSKRCGGYHPDWCLEWTTEGAIYRVLPCFGCGEFQLFGPKNQLYADMGFEIEEKLEATFRAYNNQGAKAARL